MRKLDFYTVDTDYLDYLQKYGDSKVPNHDYQSTKFYVGIILEINGYKYFAPISSFKTQQKTNYLIKVYDRNIGEMKVSSSVRCCFMIPVDDNLINRFRINTYHKIADRGLIRKELDWCKKHSDDIEKLAGKVYKWGCNENSFQYKNCCDFRNLERAYNNYNAMQEVAATRTE